MTILHLDLRFRPRQIKVSNSRIGPKDTLTQRGVLDKSRVEGSLRLVEGGIITVCVDNYT